MSLLGQSGGVKFRSKAGRGRWIFCSNTTATGVGARNSLAIPPNLETDLQSRGWKGMCPAIGVLVSGSVTADNGGGAATVLRASRAQILDYVTVLLSNRYNQPYARRELTLAAWDFIGQSVNYRANMLDSEFYDDDNARTVNEGRDPRSTFAPDIVTPGTPFQQFGTRNTAKYPTLDDRDSYWRGLEGLTTIRDTAAGTVTPFSFLESIPLCAGTGDPYSDVVPLGTICDPIQPWQMQVHVNASGEGRLVHAALGGAFSITSIGLYLYIFAARQEDAYKTGVLFYVKNEVRAQSPLRYQKDNVMLFTGNYPLNGQSFTDIVDGGGANNTYVPGIEYPNVNGDFVSGNAADWYVADEIHFPPHQLFRSPREVYMRMWNASSQRPKLRTGLPGQASIFAGRALAGRAYPAGAQAVDAGMFSTVLGAVSTCPVRVMACTLLDLEGFPGFGYVPNKNAPECSVPFIQLDGTFNFNSADPVNAINGMTDVIINTNEADRTLVQGLGKDCCTKGEVVFSPRADNPDSPKAAIVAGKVTPWVQDTTFVAAANAMATGQLSSAPSVK